MSFPYCVSKFPLFWNDFLRLYRCLETKWTSWTVALILSLLNRYFKTNSSLSVVCLPLKSECWCWCVCTKKSSISDYNKTLPDSVSLCFAGGRKSSSDGTTEKAKGLLDSEKHLSTPAHKNKQPLQQVHQMFLLKNVNAAHMPALKSHRVSRRQDGLVIMHFQSTLLSLTVGTEQWWLPSVWPEHLLLSFSCSTSNIRA